jgi:large subunit ribosomal protein L25
MEKAVINASYRKVTGKQVGVLRRQGMLPGVIYGRHIEPTPIVMNLREASRILSSQSSSSLVNIDLEGVTHATLVREKQRDFIRGTLLHVDFQAISLTEKIRTKVAIELTGTSPAVKDLNGFIVSGLDELEVECLPQYLPEKIVVDISTLAKIGDGLYVRDVPGLENVTFLDHPEAVIAVVTLAGKEEEEAPVAEVAVEEPEVIEKGKKEEEEAEETAPAKPEKGK